MSFNKANLQEKIRKALKGKIPGGVKVNLTKLEALFSKEPELEEIENLIKIRDGLMTLVGHCLVTPVSSEEIQACGEICFVCAELQLYLDGAFVKG